MNDSPFDPPYKTFREMPDGYLVTETHSDGTTRTIPTSEGQLPWNMHTTKTKSQSKPGIVQLANTRIREPSIQALLGDQRAAIYLDVPFDEKDIAKRLGARWDTALRKWYVPHGIDLNLFSRWWPQMLKEKMKTFGQL